jgi:23S rRNA (adenine-N6)-dimethyltransferase
VVEVGAGTGRITRALADHAHLVVAVEVDGRLTEVLRRRFRADARVRIVEGDILRIRLPDTPFRAFGNVPFGIGTAIQRRLLDDPTSPLIRADLLVQYDVARKRAAPWPSTLASLGWQPWWEFRLERRIQRRCFEPPPAVDAGMLSITRRDRSLLRPEERPEFVRLLTPAFARGSQPIRRSLARVLSERTWRELARERGLSPAATPGDLDVFDWVDLARHVWRRW